MKPDGVATSPTEPTEALGAAAIAEEAPTEEQQLQENENVSLPQPENIGGTNSTMPPSDKKTSGKTSQPINKTKATGKTKTGTAAAKAASTSVASRPATAQNRVANGVTRTAANGAAKKPMAAMEITKKNGLAGAGAQAKKGSTVTAVASRIQTKAVERKPVGTTRPAAASVNSGTKSAAANVSRMLSKKPAAATSSAVPKSKTTAPRPVNAPAAKPSASASSKTATIPKTTRPTAASAPHSTTSASVRSTITTTKPGASRMVSAPSAARSASVQSSKASTTAAEAKKDIGKPSTSALAKKTVVTKAATNTRPTTTKSSSKPEPPKPSTTAKRLPADTKTARPKTEDIKPVPTRKLPPRTRNAPTQPASSKMAILSNNQKQGGGSSTPTALKRQATKPTQSVMPLVFNEKPAEEHHAAQSVEPSSALVAVSEVENNLTEQMEEQTPQEIGAPVYVQDNEVLQVPSSEPSNLETVPTVEQVDAMQPEAEAPVLVESSAPSVTVGEESNNDECNISVEAPTEQEMLQQEAVMTQTFEVPVAATVSPKGIEVVEKTEQIIHNDPEEDEEERECSQQVSVSEMSGTQPTEESRPGSAGLAGSVWRAGGLLSELDSEDVSCSQQGASELSAPGVLEGTESMDDLGEASLKGADGEGASAGSPDFEKVPDIPVNEDDDDEEDDEDRVCDMEVESERAEDPHRQSHDNEDEDDDDVDMASEGITESGLESYGNADEDDFADDYRLDNLNRMQPPPIVPSASPAAQWEQANPFVDPWIQTLQPDPTRSPSSYPSQGGSETLIRAPHQAWLNVENVESPSFHPPVFMEPISCSPGSASMPSAEKDASPELATHSQGMSQPNIGSGAELAAHICSDSSTPEEVKDYSLSPAVENKQQQLLPVSPVPAALPDIMQDLGIGLEHEDDEEEPETLPADEVLGGPATAPTSVPSSPSSATEDEASDTEGEMQISEPRTEPIATGNECFGNAQVAHSLSTLEEREEPCVEIEGGGGSDTPQSATSAASYGFDCTTTSNSNAQSTTESCAKSPGIFSLENEEQLPEEAKDPSLIKELTLLPSCDPGNVDQVHLDQQGDLQPNLEQDYMLCGKVGEELGEPCSLGGTVPTETGLDNTSSSHHKEQDWEHDAQHPYYSTICEKNDGSLTGRTVHSQLQHEVLTIHVTMSPRRRSRPHVDHVTNPPRLPTDLPPRIPNVSPNVQLRRLEHHQQQIREIEQRREQRGQSTDGRVEEGDKNENNEGADNKNMEMNQIKDDVEAKKEREEKEELEEQKRNLLQLQIQQQQQELKQRQQIMEWQQELEQQNKQQNKHKTVANVLLSPSGLCTIYEALETSDIDEDAADEREKKAAVFEEIVECEDFKQICSKTEAVCNLLKDNTNSLNSKSTTHSSELIQDKVELTNSAAPESHPLGPSEQPSPLEQDWCQKVDIVQQLINQTLLLAGDSCSPLLLLPGGAGGTLSPLEASLWPNLLPPLTPPSATVTSVSSFSPDVSGSSPQGEWTVVELETHH